VLDADPPQQVLAGPVGEVEVNQEAVRRRVEPGQPLGQRPGLLDRPARQAEGEHPPRHGPRLGIVVDQQNPTIASVHRSIFGSNPL
jgi:hypothetical protein